MENRKVYLSLVVPSYNESGVLYKNIEKALIYFFNKGYVFEIIVVDDGSLDSTRELISEMAKEHPVIKFISNTQNMGKGFSVKNGVLAAQGEYILFSDADFSTPIEELETLMPNFVQGYDLVIGSRAMKDSKIILKQAWLRQSMGRIFNQLARLLGLANINDTQCGFKCFKKEAARRIFSLQRLNGFCFDVEILYIAKKLGFKIKEIPVSWSNRPDSRVAVLMDSLDMLVDLFRIRRNEWKGLYEVEQ